MTNTKSPWYVSPEFAKALSKVPLTLTDIVRHTRSLDSLVGRTMTIKVTKPANPYNKSSDDSENN